MKDIASISDSDLMQEIKADNMIAFDNLYHKYSRRIFKFGLSILKSAEDSENLVQDVFLNLWENRLKIEKDASVKSYLFTVTYHSAISLIRKKARESGFVEYLTSLQLTSEDPVSSELEYKELLKKLDEILDKLPNRQKEVYQLHRIEGLNYKQISERLNISVNTIENHMARALKTIRKNLDDYSIVAILFWYLFV
jgi:RNA polymerase sigma-70 factor (family 1)